MIARHDRPVERRQVRLLRIDARGAATAGSLEWIRGRTGDGRPGYLWRLTAPADAARTAVLGWARAGAADDQWLYRPDTGSIQTIIAGARRHAIPGGGFSFEDLEPEDRAGHRYDRRPDAMLGGALLFVVEATATAPDLARSTAYAFRRLYITRDTVFPVQVEYVDRRTRQPAKTLFVQAPTAIGRSAWRARLSVLEDYRRGTRTEWRVDRWDFRPSAVPADLFDPAALKQDRHRP